MQYYHGGPPGLTKIMPPSITGATGLSPYGTNHVSRRDRVYITTDFYAAALYAVGDPSRNGVVYEVEPVYPLEDDPDCTEPGMSYACRGARVLQSIPVDVLLRAKILAVLAGSRS